MESKEMTNEQYRDIKDMAVRDAMSDLYFEVEKEYDPEVIKAKIKQRTKKEVSPDTTQN